MIKRLMIGLASAALLATPAGAATPPREQWVRVGAHVDGGPVEVDRKSIAPWRGLWRGWWRVTLAEPRRDGTLVEKHLELVDCREGLTSTLELVSLRADGSVAGDAREPDSVALTQLSPATPGSVGDMAAAAICRLRPKPR